MTATFMHVMLHEPTRCCLRIYAEDGWLLAQVVDFPEANGPKELCYDQEWLAVLRPSHHLMKAQQRQPPLPG